MQVSQSFMENGFEYIDSQEYINNKEELSVIEELNNLYSTRLSADGPRNRAYLKLIWSRGSNTIHLAKNQSYFQSAHTNQEDGGKIRHFIMMDPKILGFTLIKRLIRKNMDFVSSYPSLEHENHLVIGMHFIQYIVDKNGASYSSPVGLHLDDEPLVFVHLVSLSKNAIGGDNLIATLKDKTIKHVIRLEQPMESLLLNNNCYHAVTPLGSKKDTALRNIILFTVEPNNTQKESSFEKAENILEPLCVY